MLVALANSQTLLLPPGIREKCVDSLVFETMIPKPMMLHYIGLLLKHKRLVLSGPSGTGKTYLAHRLARYLLERSSTDSAEADHEPYVQGRAAAVSFNMHHQSQKVSPSARRSFLIFCRESFFMLLSKKIIPFFSFAGVAVVSFRPGKSDRQRKWRRAASGCYNRRY